MNKALFLDRDGTINVNSGYVCKPEDFFLIDGIETLMRAARDAGYKIIVVTNQSGIARGYYTEADYEKITAYMTDLFAQKGIKIDAVYHCPDLESPDRKPASGMFFKAQKAFDLNMTDCLCLGDSETDVQAALGAGVEKAFLIAPPDTASAAFKIVQSPQEVVSFLCKE